MSSSKSLVPPQISTSGSCRSLGHSYNHIGRPQISKFVSTETTSDKPASSPRDKQPPRLRPSLIVDDVLPIGLLENASVTNTFDSFGSNEQSVSCTTAARNQMAVEKVQRWSGMTRTCSNWDGLRRDTELWVEDGDCYVHLYVQGASRRGPSFCIPFRALRQKKCSSMLNICYAQIASRDGSNVQQLMNMASSLVLSNREQGIVNLFIPAPDDASRQESFKWHVTTRNFFAFLLGKPLVGYQMGQTFVDLQERLQLFRSGLNNHEDFLQYAEDQGYRDFSECTDYALASLFYAEKYKIRDAWVDAFAHCVGMNESLSLSPEYAFTSRLTKALITRAYLEVDIHLGQVMVALSKFLDEDFSPAYLGLTPGARSHLDRFRRFLHSFYVKKFGYWPPPRGSAFPKALYKSMYFDFQNLYFFLVDTNSTTDLALQGPASGGICVLQNVDNFDKRHRFTPQPHPLPLVPDYAESTKKMESQKALRQLTLASQHTKANNVQTISAALAAATNTQDPAVINSNIVQEYIHFERTYSSTLNQRDEKVSVVDARKVRWLLIYGTLQYLVSALRAPKEVRDTETADYPLCCLVAEHSSWPGSSQVSTPSVISATSAANVPQTIDTYLNGSQSNFNSIQPDCHREDYFSSRTTSIRNSVEVPAPLRISTPLSYPPTRSFGSISLSGRSSRRNSLKLKPAHHCEIIVHGYGNGLNEATTSSPTQNLTRSASVSESHRSSASVLPEGAGPDTSWIRPKSPPVPQTRTSSLSKARRHARTRTPLLDANQLEQFFGSAVTSEQTDMSRSDSTSSHGSQVWSESSAISSESSADGECQERHSTAVEDSGLLGGLVSLDNTPVPTPRTRSLVKTRSPASPPPPLNAHMQAFCFNNESPQSNNYDHIHPAFRPPTADTTIGMALSPPTSPPLSPSFNLMSYYEASPVVPKDTPSHSTTRSADSTLTYADLPVSKALSRSKSHRENGIFTTISSSSSKNSEKRASAERTRSRMSILKRFYAF
ncbi:hypothetical protein M3J07_003680 [Ascochyta lentis]